MQNRWSAFLSNVSEYFLHHCSQVEISDLTLDYILTCFQIKSLILESFLLTVTLGTLVFLFFFYWEVKCLLSKWPVALIVRFTGLSDCSELLTQESRPELFSPQTISCDSRQKHFYALEGHETSLFISTNEPKEKGKKTKILKENSWIAPRAKMNKI